MTIIQNTSLKKTTDFDFSSELRKNLWFFHSCPTHPPLTNNPPTPLLILTFLNVFAQIKKAEVLIFPVSYEKIFGFFTLLASAQL